MRTERSGIRAEPLAQAHPPCIYGEENVCRRGFGCEIARTREGEEGSGRKDWHIVDQAGSSESAVNQRIFMRSLDQR
jgi:hypothetical protein